MRMRRWLLRILAGTAIAMLWVTTYSSAWADPKSVSVNVTRDSWAVMLPDGHSALVFAWEYDGTVVRVNLDNMTAGTPIRYWMRHPYEAVFSADGQYGYFLSGHDPILDVPEGYIATRNVESVAKVRLSDLSIMWRYQLLGTQSKRQLVLSADGSTIYVSGGVNDVQGWDGTGSIVRLNAADGTLIDRRWTGLYSTTGIALLSNGNILIASKDVQGGQVIEFDAALNRLYTFDGTGDVGYIRVMPDEQHAIVASYGSSFCYLKLTTPRSKYCPPPAQYMNRAIPHSLVLNSAGDAAFSTQTIDWDYWGYQKAQGLLKIVPSGDSITVTEIGARQSGLYAMSTDTMTSRLITYSPIERNIKLYELPSAPVNLSSAPRDAGAVISFTPGADNGLAITHYQYSVNGGAWTSTSPSTTASPMTVSGLVNDDTATVRIRAVSALGAGAASDTVTVKATQLPETPTALSVLRGDLSAEISFTPGQNGALGPVWNYQYQVDTGTWTDLAPFDASPPITVPLPDNNQAHTVRIRARNDAGPGPASVAVSMPAISAVAAPTAVSVTRDDGAMSIGFTPGSTGNQVIVGYEYSLNGGSTWQGQTPAATSSPIRVTGISNSDTFTVRVRGVGGALGASESSTSVSVAAVALPADPTITVAGLQSETATVQLQFADDGNSKLLRTEVDVYKPDALTPTLWEYVKTVRRDFSNSDTLTVTMTLPGLTANQRYLFVGTGTSRIGRNDADNWTQPPSSSVEIKTLGTFSLTGAYPVQPLALAKRGGETLTITGTDFYESQTSVTIGSAACTDIRVESSTQLTCVTPAFSTTGSETVTVSRWGASQSTFGVTNVGINAPTTPGQPEVLSTSSTSNSIVVYFRPGADGGGDILNYEYAIDVPSVWIPLSPSQTTSPLTISGLTTSTAYKIYLRAQGSGVGGMADGQPAAPFWETTTSRVAAPTNLVVARGNQRLDLSWTNPVTSFAGAEFTINGGETWTAVGTQSSVSVTGLVNGLTYKVAVRAYEPSGVRGLATAFTSATPATVPSAPLQLSARPSYGVLKLTFDVGATGGAPISKYQYSLNSGTWSDGDTLGNSTLRRAMFFREVTAGETYTVRVRAVNAQGEGAASETVTVRALNIPQTPTIAVESMTSTSLTLLASASGAYGRPIDALMAQLWTWFGEDGIADSQIFTAIEVGTVTRRFTFTGLNPGQTYFFKAIASGAGGANYSDLNSVQLSIAPAAPKITSISNGSRTVAVQFTAPVSGSSPLVKYQYSTDGGANWQDRTDAGGLGSPLTISGLTNGKTYQVKLRALNQTDTGTASAPVVAAPVPNCLGPAVTGADFSGCDLRNRNDFHSADLRFASFESANVSGVSFAGSDLYGSVFRGASAVDANFAGANLRATGFADAQLMGASIDSGAGDVIGTPATLPENRVLVNGYFRSNLAELNTLTISADSAVTLDRTFTSSVKTYAASVATNIETVTVSPATTNAQSGIRVNSEFVPSGMTSSAIQLDAGANVIDVVVTAADGSTTDTYTVTVTRGFVSSGGGGAGGGGGGAPSSAAAAGGGGAATPDTATAVTETQMAQPKTDTATAKPGQGTATSTPTQPETSTAVVPPLHKAEVIRLAFAYAPKQVILSAPQLRALRNTMTTTTKAITVLGYVTRTKSTAKDRAVSLARATRAAMQVRQIAVSVPLTVRGAGGATAAGCARTKNNCVVILVARFK